MPNTQKKLYEIQEVIQKNGGPIPMSLAGAYKAAKDGKFPTVRIGRRVFIPSWYIEKILSEPTNKN